MVSFSGSQTRANYYVCSPRPLFGPLRPLTRIHARISYTPIHSLPRVTNLWMDTLRAMREGGGAGHFYVFVCACVYLSVCRFSMSHLIHSSRDLSLPTIMFYFLFFPTKFLLSKNAHTCRHTSACARTSAQNVTLMRTKMLLVCVCVYMRAWGKDIDASDGKTCPFCHESTKCHADKPNRTTKAWVLSLSVDESARWPGDKTECALRIVMLRHSWAGDIHIYMVPYVLEFAQNDRQPQCTLCMQRKNEECGMLDHSHLCSQFFCYLVLLIFSCLASLFQCVVAVIGEMKSLLQICFLFIALRMRRISS